MLNYNEIMALPNIEKRFWNHVGTKEKGKCWNWIGCTGRGGYGVLSTLRNLAGIKAHRLSWMIHYGNIPDGLFVCHACDNPGCVNPDHLMLGTTIANTIDAYKKKRLKMYKWGFGENNNSAKLSNDQVKLIREEYANGSQYKELAEKYQCSNIQRIVRNESYIDKNYQPINGNARKRPYRKVVPEEIQKLIIESNESACQLSKILPYSKPTILKIRNGAY